MSFVLSFLRNKLSSAINLNYQKSANLELHY